MRPRYNAISSLFTGERNTGLIPFMSESFQEYRLNLERERHLILFPVAFFMVILLGVEDYFVLNANRDDINLQSFMLFQGGVAASLFFSYVLIKMRLIPRTVLPVFGVILSLVLSVLVTVNSLAAGGFSSMIYPAMFLVLIGVNLFLPWRAVWVFWNGLGAISVYIVGGLIFDPEYAWMEVLNNLSYLIGMLIVALFISHYKEMTLRREFTERSRLEAQDSNIQIELLRCARCKQFVEAGQLAVRQPGKLAWLPVLCREQSGAR